MRIEVILDRLQELVDDIQDEASKEEESGSPFTIGQLVRMAPRPYTSGEDIGPAVGTIGVIRTIEGGLNFVEWADFTGGHNFYGIAAPPLGDPTSGWTVTASYIEPA